MARNTGKEKKYLAEHQDGYAEARMVEFMLGGHATGDGALLVKEGDLVKIITKHFLTKSHIQNQVYSLAEGFGIDDVAKIVIKKLFPLLGEHYDPSRVQYGLRYCMDKSHIILTNQVGSGEATELLYRVE